MLNYIWEIIEKQENVQSVLLRETEKSEMTEWKCTALSAFSNTIKSAIYNLWDLVSE